MNQITSPDAKNCGKEGFLQVYDAQRAMWTKVYVIVTPNSSVEFFERSSRFSRAVKPKVALSTIKKIYCDELSLQENCLRAEVFAIKVDSAVLIFRAPDSTRRENWVSMLLSVCEFVLTPSNLSELQTMCQKTVLSPQLYAQLFIEEKKQAATPKLPAAPDHLKVCKTQSELKSTAPAVVEGPILELKVDKKTEVVAPPSASRLPFSPLKQVTGNTLQVKKVEVSAEDTEAFQVKALKARVDLLTKRNVELKIESVQAAAKNLELSSENQQLTAALSEWKQKCVDLERALLDQFKSRSSSVASAVY